MRVNPYLNFNGQCAEAFKLYERAQGLSVSLSVADPADADRIFNALAEKATVQMAIQKTFWSVRFGMLVDRFGIPWMVNCEQAA